jgi:hypothetical protein
LLRHLIGQRLVDGGVVVNPVARAHHGGALRERTPCNPDARLKFVIVRAQQRIGIAGLARQQGAIGVWGTAYRLLTGEVRTNIKIHQTVLELSDGRLKIPAHADIQAQIAFDSPVVIHEPIHPGRAEIFVRIAECDGTGGGQALQEIG